MKRRSFIKKTSATCLALTVIPSITLAQSQETTYSLAELMGKATIELYGKDINLRKEAHDAFIEMKRAAYTGGVDLKIVSSS